MLFLPAGKVHRTDEGNCLQALPERYSVAVATLRFALACGVHALPAPLAKSLDSGHLRAFLRAFSLIYMRVGKYSDKMMNTKCSKCLIWQEPNAAIGASKCEGAAPGIPATAWPTQRPTDFSEGCVGIVGNYVGLSEYCILLACLV